MKKTINQSDLNAFITKALFENVMRSGLDSWDNYSGPDWSGWLCGPAHNRDSDNVQKSNFEAALDLLGGERDGIVEVRRCGHWGCGWFEQIMVNVKNKKAVKILFKIKESLNEYALLDEVLYFEMESDDEREVAEDSLDEAKELLQELTDLPEEALTDELLKDFAAEVIRESNAYSGEKYFNAEKARKIACGSDYACGSNLEELRELNGLNRVR